MVQRPLFPRKVTREELNSPIDKAASLIRTVLVYKFIPVVFSWGKGLKIYVDDSRTKLW